MKSYLTKTEYRALGLLIVLILAVYGRVITYDFLNFDDDRYILDNPFVSSGLSWDSLKWAFTTRYEANWHPVTWLSHMLDVSLSGLNPGFHHAVNLGFHLANTLLLLLLLYRMTRDYWPALMVAALFALHPLHIESVAWIAERKDLLSTFFLFLTLTAYHSYTIKPGYFSYVTTLSCYILGLMAKPMLVTLPLILYIIDYWPLERFRADNVTPNQRHTRLLLEKIPFAILATASVVLTYNVQQLWGATAPLGQQNIWFNLATAVTNYIRYIFMMFFPFKLAVFYPYSDLIIWWKLCLCLIATLAISATAFVYARKYPYVLAGWLWYLVTLLPVVGIINIGFHEYADRYTYIPLTGMFIALVWLVTDISREHGWNGYVTRGGVTLVIILSIVTPLQLRHWKNSLTLFSHAADVTSNNWLAHQHISQVLLINCNIPAAFNHINEAIRVKPDNSTNFVILGSIYRNMRREDDAIKALEQALLLDPGNARGLQNLGVLYADTGRTDNADRVVRQLERIHPDYARQLENYIRLNHKTD